MYFMIESWAFAVLRFLCFQVFYIFSICFINIDFWSESIGYFYVYFGLKAGQFSAFWP